MIAVNHLDGLMPLADWDDLAGARRSSTCASRTSTPPATSRARSTCRCRSCASRHGELPRERRLAALLRRRPARLLRDAASSLQHGYDAANLSGGYTTYQALHAVGLAPG